MKRCDWCEKNELYINYHDHEWGIPVHNDREHFELLVLESMQSGLSWLTILKKRENFRMVFDQFDVEKVACYDEQKVQELLNDSGIIRNKLKIHAAINNARCFIEVQKEYGNFDKYIWSFVNYKSIINYYKRIEDTPTSTELSKAISKDLKKRGFKFLGPVTTYSFLQATGLINDHIESCFRKKQV
ncbi:DNA-3-methyladenine glycosylase I [Haloplasma contractile]|uniref:3-methyl-adenine DNA glycosylase I protein n=1 Tax=Haloplasma contractile SSD-17B TaxID=1033810 RepID=U2EBF5_9MOLU|nr:DNA-3-methyladenine glycosylase I [Haloplasma contractile]ERJ12126.1 3-methyl-adenine DNA glycosylase I protein [Haloplasma contractile SSD-17B]